MMLETLTSGVMILAGSQNWCTPPRSPTITVQASFQNIEYNDRYSSALLETKKINTVSPYGPGARTKVGGLTEGSIRVSQQVALAGNRLGNWSCYWYDRVAITVELDPEVFIAQEYRRGSCRHAVITEHEHKHVRVDQNLVQSYRQVFIQAVRQAMASRRVFGPFRNERTPDFQQAMSDQIASAIKGVTARMEADRARLQQAVDSREEYDRVAAACPSESP